MFQGKAACVSMTDRTIVHLGKARHETRDDPEVTSWCCNEKARTKHRKKCVLEKQKN